MLSEHGWIWVARVMMFLIVVGLWEIAASFSESINFFVGAPSVVASELVGLFKTEPMVVHITSTAGAAMAGLFLGTFLGAFCGLTLWRSKKVAKTMDPFIVAIGSFPVLALAPLMILWFGVGVEMKIAVACFTTVFISLGQAYRGANLVADEYVAVLQGMQATQSQTFRVVIVPGSIDWLLGSFRINVGLALLGAFIGEFIASDQGLGYLIMRSASLYNVPRAMAAATLIVIIAFAFDGLGRALERRRHALVQLISVPEELWVKRNH